MQLVDTPGFEFRTKSNRKVVCLKHLLIWYFSILEATGSRRRKLVPSLETSVESVDPAAALSFIRMTQEVQEPVIFCKSDGYLVLWLPVSTSCLFKGLRCLLYDMYQKNDAAKHWRDWKMVWFCFMIMHVPLSKISLLTKDIWARALQSWYIPLRFSPLRSLKRRLFLWDV